MAEDPVLLARRFEPILFFHPSERFFPSDPKRYVEACALWKAERPFDEKSSWGGPGAPFPRAPMIAPMKIAALEAEASPGSSFLGEHIGSTFPFLVDDGTEERFLSAGRWNIPAGFDTDGSPATPAAEPDVTATSRNNYSNREILNQLYNVSNDSPLRDSRFWYFAELFDTERLRRLLTSQPADRLPDLSAIFQSIAPRNPALLCYYFFYPAHEEPLPPPCDGTLSGAEFACFSGEWAAVAILIERGNTTQQYEPGWIGFTGRPNLSSGQALDDDRRVGMTVSKWGGTDPSGTPLPTTTQGHPRLFVSLGTHSFYLEPGTKVIVPYPVEESPEWCGRFDTPHDLEQYLDSTTTDHSGHSLAGVLKIVGGLLGAIPGGVTAASAAAIVEDDFTSPYGPDKTPDVLAPDQTAVEDSLGKIICSAGLSLSDVASADLQPWASQENLVRNGRRYSFIVNRATQVWWPAYDLKSGFRGRWGPRVAHDALARRAGMRFPEFWRMFFVGLAKAGSL